MITKDFRELTRGISRGLIEIEKDGVSCCGLPMLQSHILIELGENPNISLNKLATNLSSEKGSVSRSVQSLVEKGLVNRVTEAADRRAVLLSLSDKGQENVDKISEEMGSYTTQILSQFQTDEIDSLFYYLNKLNEALINVQDNKCSEGVCK